MSYGDSELAPTYYFSGIIFNPSFYSSSSSTYLTQSTAKNYFLSYPLSQGSETFSSNVKLQSTLTDTSGSVGTSGQILSSTATGVSWINGVGNSYISYNTSTLPFTLSLASNSNLYILFSGTTGSGGIMTIPTTGITNGTYIHVKNISSGTVNLSSSFIQFQTAASGTAILDLNSGESFQAYFNGTYWVQSSITKKVDNLTINNTLTVGAFGTDTLIQKSNHTTGEEINMYSTTVTGDMFIGKVLPSPYTLRLCNTTAGSSGASVHCCNIGIDGSNINNATNPTTGIIKLGNSLTTGTLYIGCGSATAAHTSGPIIIGADSTATGGINIGTDTDLVVPAVDTINIGSASYTTNIKGTQTNTGLITANGGITIPSGQSLTVVGTQTSTGLITANGGITVASGQVLTVSGTQTSTGLITANGGVSGTTLTASGLITANGGITVASLQTLASNKLDAVTVAGAQTIGGNITTGSITMGGAMTSGDINIGTLSTSDIYLGNATNATTGTDKGTCHIQKCQFGTNGSIFREMRFGAVGTGSTPGTITFTPAMVSAPIVFATISSVQSNQVISIVISAVSTTGFTYNKTYIASGGSLGTSGEAFNWIAISV